MTFPEVLMFAAADADFVREVDRLRGTSLATRGRSPMNDAIDDATGKSADDARVFAETVYDLIWCRCPGLAPTPPEGTVTDAG